MKNNYTELLGDSLNEIYNKNGPQADPKSALLPRVPGFPIRNLSNYFKEAFRCEYGPGKCSIMLLSIQRVFHLSTSDRNCQIRAPRPNIQLPEGSGSWYDINRVSCET